MTPFFKDIKLIQKRKKREIEELVEIRLEKKRYEEELAKIRKEVSIFEEAIGEKKKKLEQEERDNEEELDKELLEMEKKRAAKEASKRTAEANVTSLQSYTAPPRKMPKKSSVEETVNKQGREKDTGLENQMKIEISLNPDMLKGDKKKEKVVQCVAPSTSYQSQSLHVAPSSASPVERPAGSNIRVREVYSCTVYSVQLEMEVTVYSVQCTGEDQYP